MTGIPRSLRSLETGRMYPGVCLRSFIRMVYRRWPRVSSDGTMSSGNSSVLFVKIVDSKVTFFIVLQII
jgi:hypothetical protein